MNINKNNLIWIDLEMTGLDINKDQIIEIATLITDKHLNILDIGPDLVISQNNKILDSMNQWNKNTHSKSGLLKLVKESVCTLKQAEIKTIDFLKKWVIPNSSPMCGNSIYHDRLFLNKYMPNLFLYFHYRSIDVSTVKSLIEFWKPELFNKIKKINKHRAMSDITESLNELIFYRKYIF